MSAIHGDKFRLNADLFAIDWATNSVTKLNDPCVFRKFWFNQLRDKDTIVTTSFDIAKTFLILH